MDGWRVSLVKQPGSYMLKAEVSPTINSFDNEYDEYEYTYGTYYLVVTLL